MYQHHRNLAGLVGGQHADAGLPADVVAAHETDNVRDVAEIAVGEEVGQRRRQIGLQRHDLAGRLDGLRGQRIVQFEPAAALRAEVGQAAFKAEKGGGREARLTRIEGMGRVRSVGDGGARGDERHTQAVAAVLVGQADGLVVGADEQLAELLRLPGEAGVDHREREALAVRRGHTQLVPRIELADALGGGDALGQAGVVQVAGQAEARIEDGRTRRRRDRQRCR